MADTTLVDAKTDYDEITYDSSFYKLANPYIASVWIKVPKTEPNDKSEKILSVSESNIENSPYLYDLPQNFVSFNFNRSLYGVGYFNITLFDPEFSKIEKTFVENKAVIAFQYGYEGKEDTIRSPWYLGLIVDYKIQFLLEGALISLNGLSTGHEFTTMKYVQPAAVIKEAMGDRKAKISEIVAKLAENLKLKTKIEPTKGNDFVGEGLKSFNEVYEKSLTAPNTSSSLQYIMDCLKPLALNEKEVGGYVAFIEVPRTKESTPILHFHTPGYKEEKELKKKIPLYTKFKSPNSVLRDFQPDWQMSKALLLGGEKTKAISYDPFNKYLIKKEINFSVDEQPYFKDQQQKTVDTAKKSPDSGAAKSIVVPSSTQKELDVKTKVVYDSTLNFSLQAELSIQGTVEFGLTDNIAVHVYIPKGPEQYNENGQNKVHWTSGEFIIKEIRDSISNGDFITSFSLMTSGRTYVVTTAAGEKNPQATSSGT